VDKSVVVIGGGLVGCEVACFLCKHGKKVTIAEQLDSIALDVGIWNRAYEIGRVQKAGVTVINKARAVEITKEGVGVEENGKKKVISAGTVVLAVGASSNRELLETLASGSLEVYAIGDCVVPRKIMHATSQGLQVGLCL
jgi:pyruvate/2-oxoglutarate dehydrogenase complex dihydrolipoamide dehydrogenase (E3) component